MTVFRKTLFLLSIFSVLIFACSDNKSASQSINELVTINNASLPNLFRDSQGNVLISYVTQKNELSSLWLSTWQNQNWSNPELVASGDNWFVNWADFPSVVKNDEHLFAHWLEMNGEGTYAYGVRYSTRSADKKWKQPQWLHTDKSPTEHGFVSLQPHQNGSYAIWLDGRKMQSAGHASHTDHPKLDSVEDIKGMTLRSAFIDNSGIVSDRDELDSLTCDCCQTTMVNSQNGIVVAYRDREIIDLDTEIRDIKILFNKNGSWQEAKNTPIDNWNIQACPVNGPVLAANKDKIALAWFTAANAKPKVKVAFSEDNAHSFQTAFSVDENNNLGRVAVDWINSDTIFISWVGLKAENTVLFYRTVSLDGSMTETQIATKIDMTRSSGIPQVAQVKDNEVLLTWTKTGEQASIQSKVIRIN